VNWETISAIGQIVGALAVVISLIYVAREIRSNARAARLAAIKSLIVVTSVYFMGGSGTFAQDKSQALTAESPSNAQEPALAEKIRDLSPDKKFAMRISYDAELNNQGD
jgi:hypothetical protein